MMIFPSVGTGSCNQVSTWVLRVPATLCRRGPKAVLFPGRLWLEPMPQDRRSGVNARNRCERGAGSNNPGCAAQHKSILTVLPPLLLIICRTVPSSVQGLVRGKTGFLLCV